MPPTVEDHAHCQCFLSLLSAENPELAIQIDNGAAEDGTTLLLQRLWVGDLQDARVWVPQRESCYVPALIAH